MAHQRNLDNAQEEQDMMTKGERATFTGQAYSEEDFSGSQQSTSMYGVPGNLSHSVADEIINSD